MGDLTGCTLDHYVVQSRLGQGGMGVVYRARDTRLDRDVAIKVIRGDAAAASRRIGRFVSEARAAGSLNHPGILTVLEFGSHEGQPFIVTELLEGRSMRAVIAEGALPAERVLRYAIEIADALAAAHARGITHRDLKPANLFLTAEGRIKILDFGLAKQHGDEDATDESTRDTTVSLATMPGALIGSFAYMAPEQIRGEPADPRADVFAVGLILHELLTGSHPFRRTSTHEAIAAVLRDEAPSFEAEVANCPAGLQEIVTRCLSKDRSRRFASGRELAKALRRLRSDRPARSARPFLGKLRVPALLVVIAGATGLWFYERCPSSGETENSVMVLIFQDLTAGIDEPHFAEGMTDALISRLGRIASLRVVSATTSRRYRNVDLPLADLGKKLGVQFFVEGSVMRVEGRVVVRARLIDAKTEHQLWAEEYNRGLESSLVLQSEIARDIASQVGVVLSEEDESRLFVEQDIDTEAIDEYLRGRMHYERTTRESWRMAADHYSKAIEIAPDFALAHAALSILHGSADELGDLDPQEAQRLSFEHARRALALEERLAEAHVAMGTALALTWSWSEAERELRRGVALNPGSSDTHGQLAWLLALRGRLDEALVEAEIAARRLDPQSTRRGAQLGWIHYLAHRYDDARAQWMRVLESEPGYAPAIYHLGLVDAIEGRHDEALRALRGVRGLGTRPATMEAMVLALAGRDIDARRLLAELSSRQQRGGGVSSALVALVHVALGEPDSAITSLQSAFDIQDPYLAAVLVDPFCDPLRNDPRFVELWRRVETTEWRPVDRDVSPD